VIHTLTLNPTLDLTYIVDAFLQDDTTRAHTVYRSPGGKGINVARVATRLKHENVALGFIAGTTGLEVTQLLEAEGVNTWFTPVEGVTRTNPILQDKEGHQIRVSAPGPSATLREVESLWESLFCLREPDFLLASGSRLAGVPDNFYARILIEAKKRGIKTVVDADGAELERGIRTGAYLVKPNKHELMRFVGRELIDIGDVIAASREMIQAGVSVVAASLGAEGALYITSDQALRAIPPKIQVASAVGAGDSFLAGLLVKLSEGSNPLEALKFAVASGTATATIAGTQLCTLERIIEILPEVQTEVL
jgi:1-phosphofructokinase family hexose kinase